MNKKLLALAAIAAMSVSSISAAEVSLLGDDCVYVKENAGQPAVATPVDGVYTIALGDAPEQDWDAQFFVKANKDLAAGQKYVFSFEAKTTSPRKVDLQFHKGNPGDYLHYTIGATEGSSFDATAEWAKYTFNGTVPAEAADANIIAMNLSTVKEAGTISFKDIVWNLIEEGGDTPDPKPEQPADVVASWYTGNGATFGGWDNSDRENKVTFDPAAVEDGKPCLKVVSTEALEADTWKAQIGINELSLVEGTTYYLSFDIKGTPADGFVFSMQAPEDGYANRGDFGPFAATDNWNHVVLSAVCNGANTTQMTCTIGGYVGTLYLTNVVLSTTNPAGVDAVEVAPVVNHWTVYNLMGVKVLDTDNEAAVNELANGIYVINGKKVAIRH